MTVEVRQTLVRFVLLCGGAVVLILLWQARAAGAQESTSPESAFPAQPAAMLPDAGATIDGLAPASIPPSIPPPTPPLGLDLGPLVGPVAQGLDELAPQSTPASSTPAPAPATAESIVAPASPAPAVAETASPADPSPDLLVDEPQPADPTRPPQPSPTEKGAPAHGAVPSRDSERKPLPTPGLGVVALAVAWATVLGARAPNEAAWRPGIPRLRPLSRPG